MGLNVQCQQTSGLTKDEIWRPHKLHFWTGPGLAVRVLGDVTAGDAMSVLREVDEIFINAIREAGLYDSIWQAFAVFLPVRCANIFLLSGS